MGFGKSRSADNKRLPTGNAILEYISDEDIFRMYLGGIPSKPISSPLREDTNPSFSLFYAKEHGKVFFKDFATGEKGDCFVFVMKLFRLPSKVATFNKIAKDFNLTQFRFEDSFLPTTPKKVYVKKGNRRESVNLKKLTISVTVRPWKIRDKNYWFKKYGLNKDQLEYCNIFPIEYYFINGYCRKAEKLAYAFVEEKDGVQTFKIYQPYADKENKWINNNDYSTWELWTQLPAKGDVLIITSSRKDALVIKSLFPSVFITSCSLQSENVHAKESVVNELKNRFKEIFIMYDNDFNSDKNRGRLAGIKLAKETGFRQIEIPDGCQVKDPSDYIEEFGKQDLMDLILRLINKKYEKRTLNTKTIKS